MKKLIGALLGLAAAFGGEAAAQGPVQMIAYDYCQADYWLDYAISCGIYLIAVDGSKGAFVSDGIEPAWSPDGSRIAFTTYATAGGLSVVNLSDWTLVNLTSGDSPAWSPDGMKIAFRGNQAGTAELYVMNADGSGVTQITHNVGFVGRPAWSSDGGRIAFDCEVEIGNRDICAINADGTELVRLTSDPASDSGAAFSPADGGIAFATTRFGSNAEIAIMNADGSGVRPVGAGTVGVDPAWSPDGTRIVFTIPFGGACEADGRICPDSLYVMNADGTGLQLAGSGDHPAWTLSRRPVAWFGSQGCNGLTCAFDGSGSWGGDGGLSYVWNFGDGTSDSGSTVSHTYAAGGAYVVTLTVADNGGSTATQTRNVTLNTRPVASFTTACTGVACNFNGSASSDPDGTITSYAWVFGDGTTGSGATVSHTYAAGGAYVVTLTVADNGGSTATQTHSVTVNTPPVASFTTACTGIACNFNGSASSDSDGTITSYAWNLGDGTVVSGPTVSHTYATGGSYLVTLTVTDNSGATGVQSKSLTVLQPLMHVGDLDGAVTNQGKTWTATVTITVDDSNYGPVANATVSGSWSNGGTGSCTTNGSGQCAVPKSTIPKNTASVIFTVVNVTHPMLTYKSSDNHDPDGDSNGTTITVNRP